MPCERLIHSFNGYKKEGYKSTEGITGKEKAEKGEDTKETNPR
jgi:hypothetical protein